jgi:hypothetical protein
MYPITRLALCAIALLAAGCARQINIAPPLEALDARGVARIEKTVAYYISPSNSAKEVETPAGGGDRVKYQPYREVEPALRQVLSNLFTKVVSVPSLDDKQFLASNGVDFVFVPTIETDSSSDSSVTWPPTRFTVTLDCLAVDRSGTKVWHKKVSAQGSAAFNEFVHDRSLSARRASRDAFMLLQREIHDASEFR